MNILDIIENKKIGKELSKQEIEYFIENYTIGEVKDYQAAALIMAICINGMTKNEIVNLTMAMANSGDILDLREIQGKIIDKHSTGGVGDKVTLIVLPIISALGIPVGKMSGRGLGITGGTIDKLESIPGYNTSIDTNRFIKNVQEVGISLIGQTMNLAPADKKIYALRDTISCTDSIPLIASSIMSKKIAAGANKIVLDVTCGSGAFMKNKEDAIELSKTMRKIGKLADKETVCIITNMDEPLGYAVGNNLEVIEAIHALNGDIQEDVQQVVLELGSYMMKLYGIDGSIEENKNKILENIKNGKALKKFIELVQNQGGDISYIKDTSKFEKAKFVIPVISDKDGFIEEINARKVGEISGSLGAGRIRKEDDIDQTVGIILSKKVSNKVTTGDILAYIYANDENLGNKACKELKDIYKIASKEVLKPQVILDIVE